MASKPGPARRFAAAYIRGGWRSVSDGARRCTKALWRHLFRLGDDDPVRGVPPELIHDAQVAWNALARLELLLTAPPAPAPDHGCIDVKTKGARQWRPVHSWTLKSMPLVSISA
jgi:hypothetical protein